MLIKQITIGLPESNSHVEIQPLQVARLFLEMDSEQQAEFFNELAFAQFNFQWQMNNVALNENLTAAGKMAMKKIGRATQD